MTKRYRKLEDGERAVIPDGLMQVACCDCGLVHVFKITRARKGFAIRAWRHKRATSTKRITKRRQRLRALAKNWPIAVSRNLLVDSAVDARKLLYDAFGPRRKRKARR